MGVRVSNSLNRAFVPNGVIKTVCFGSKADRLYVNAARPLYPTRRTNAEASLNVCVGPIPEVDATLTCSGGVDEAVTRLLVDGPRCHVLSLEQRARHTDIGDTEVDDEAGDIDEGGDKGSGRGRGILSDPRGETQLVSLSV